MDELLELHKAIEEQRYDDALGLVSELEEMAKDDKISKIYSYAVILLLHLIKQVAESRQTRSWTDSIEESTHEIRRTNKRRKSGGFYLNDEELIETLAEAFPTALRKAAREAFEGSLSTTQLSEKISREAVLQTAFEKIKTGNS